MRVDTLCWAKREKHTYKGDTHILNDETSLVSRQGPNVRNPQSGVAGKPMFLDLSLILCRWTKPSRIW